MTDVELRTCLPQQFSDWDEWSREVRRLAAELDAVILAHNYQRPEIQDVADHVGDSLALSRLAAAARQSTIVFAGVHFMAETAKILSPDKRVVIPDARAGCSLADTIDADQLRVWKAEHPGAAVVAYVNTTAEVKAESDICCTSSNAVDVVNSLPADQEVLFLPDMFLGAHVKRMTGRTNLRTWMGECHVHAAISPTDLRRSVLPSRVRLFDHGTVADLRRRAAGRAHPHPVNRSDARPRAAQHGRKGARGDGDRDAAPAAPRQSRHHL
jgi:quinolinate synthase